MQQSLFGPIPCQCGEPPKTTFMPNYTTSGRWQVYCRPNCRRAFGQTEDEAIHQWNTGRGAQ
jgi:hypothetical protein